MRSRLSTVIRMFPLPFRSWDRYDKLAVREELRARKPPILPIYTTIPRRVCKSRNRICTVLGMNSDRNIVSTKDLGFFTNSWIDVISRMAIPLGDGAHNAFTRPPYAVVPGGRKHDSSPSRISVS